MRYYLLSTEQPDAAPPESDDLGAIMRDVAALEQEMKAAGVWVFNGHLHPPNAATVVRATGDDVLTTDGPYAESKEYVGGISVIKVPDLDTALQWARKMARASTLPVEVRPFQGEAED